MGRPSPESASSVSRRSGRASLPRVRRAGERERGSPRRRPLDGRGRGGEGRRLHPAAGHELHDESHRGRPPLPGEHHLAAFEVDCSDNESGWRWSRPTGRSRSRYAGRRRRTCRRPESFSASVAQRSVGVLRTGKPRILGDLGSVAPRRRDAEDEDVEGRTPRRSRRSLELLLRRAPLPEGKRDLIAPCSCATSPTSGTAPETSTSEPLSRGAERRRDSL